MSEEKLRHIASAVENISNIEEDVTRIMEDVQSFFAQWADSGVDTQDDETAIEGVLRAVVKKRLGREKEKLIHEVGKI